MFRVGRTYLISDPDQDSGNVADLRRLWMRRVPVVLVKRRWLTLNPKKVYLVRTEDGREFYTGKLFKGRQAHHPGPRANG